MSRTNKIPFADINGEYPVAGIDNNSQGFRDNFSKIKAGLAMADADLDYLYSNTARGDRDNNLNGILLDNAITNRLFGEATVSTSWPEEAYNMSKDGYDYHRYVLVDGSTNSWLIQGWPTHDERTLISKIRVEFDNIGSVVDRTMEILPAAGGSIRVDDTLTSNSIAIPAGKSVVVDIWSTDSGKTIYMSKIGAFRTVA